jgi:galacturan 1,4-alpha-galacturonidase
VAAGIHCSSSNPCDGFYFENVNIKNKDGKTADKFLCSNIANQAKSGIPCTGTCPANWPQQLQGNN